jgi:transcriptional regulator with XRE-family HTH domain
VPSNVVQVNSHSQADPALILQLTARPRVALSDIARASGTSLSFVSACAHGRKRPTKRVLEAAERLLGVPGAQLFPVWPIPNVSSAEQ